MRHFASRIFRFTSVLFRVSYYLISWLLLLFLFRSFRCTVNHHEMGKGEIEKALWCCCYCFAVITVKPRMRKRKIEKLKLRSFRSFALETILIVLQYLSSNGQRQKEDPDNKRRRNTL